MTGVTLCFMFHALWFISVFVCVCVSVCVFMSMDFMPEINFFNVMLIPWQFIPYSSHNDVQ